jgi:cytochrome c556
MRTFTTAVLCAMSAAMPHYAYPQQSDYERAQIVTTRQQRMSDLQTAYWILLKVKDGKSDDYAGAADAARSMPAMIDVFLSLLVPGTARGEAAGSRAKPEIWTEADGVANAAQTFKDEAQALAAAADAGDPGAYAVAFERFTEACTGCHGFRPSSGGQFRFAVGE